MEVKLIMKTSIFKTLAATTNPGVSFFSEGVAVLQSGIYVLAAIALVVGIVNFADSFGDGSPGAKKLAIGGISSAVLLFLVGYKLVPSLTAFFN